MSDEWIPTVWIRKSDLEDMQELMPLEIHRTRGQDYKGDRFAIRQADCVVSTKGVWQWEPQPSSRTPAFLKRFRFETFDAAVDVASRTGSRFVTRPAGIIVNDEQLADRHEELEARRLLAAERVAREAAEQRATVALEALAHLVDAQNGPPLLGGSAERFWTEAMEKARAILEK